MKPILFNTEMVKAILDGRKKVTRRNPFHFTMKEGYNPNWSGYSLGEYFTGHIESGVCLYSRGAHDVWGVRSNIVKPKYNVNDILYVRETWSEWTDGYVYKIPDNKASYNYPASYIWKWNPSIHMPKEAARIFLRVKDVRVERLQDMPHDAPLEEGIKGYTKDGELYKYAVSDDWWIDYHSKHRKEFKGTYWQDMPKNPTVAFSYLWNSTINRTDIDIYGWEANPWVWVIEFERISKEEALNQPSTASSPHQKSE